jgi:hypothetical protein
LDALLKLQQKIRTESYNERRARNYAQNAVRYVDYDCGRPMEDLVAEAQHETALILATGEGTKENPTGSAK